MQTRCISTNCRIAKRIFLLIIVFVSCIQSFAQISFSTSEPDITNYDSRVLNGENPILVFATGGTNINYLFSASELTDLSWEIINQNPAGIFSLSSTTAKDVNVIGTVVAGTTYLFTVRLTQAGAGGGVTMQDFELHISKSAIATSLVLDQSGSMGIQADIAGNTDTRLDVLQYSVNEFIDFYSAFSLDKTLQIADDFVGAVYFSSTATTDALGLVSTYDDTNLTTLKANISALLPQNLTALGQGVDQASTQLSGAVANSLQNIILFTDGIQNVAPKIHAVFVSPGNAGNKVYLGETVPADGGLLTSNPGLKISAIAMAVTTPYYEELERITKCTNGYFSPVIRKTDFTLALQSQLTIALKSQSPQIVGYTDGILNGQSAESEFEINAGIKTVVFELFTADSIANVNLSIEKDGTDVTRLGKFIRAANYILFSIALPAKNSSGLVVSKGKWKMKITDGSPGQAYRTSALVDDHALNYTTAVTDNGKINSPLKLELTLAYNKKPLTNAGVTALVLKPGQDLGTLLATATSRKTDNPTNAGPADLSPGNSKLQALLADTAIYNSLLPKSQVVSLTSANDGTYSATFTGTDITGPYNVIFLISGSDSTIGKYIRTETRSTVLELDEVNLDESSPSVVRSGDTLKVNIRPRSKSGLYLGPDYTNAIQLTSSAGKIGQTIDNVDGSYTILVFGVPENVNPDITVTVLGQEIYKGKANSFGEPWHVTYWWIWVILILLIILILYLRRKK
jgi:hypothetical protein